MEQEEQWQQREEEVGWWHVSIRSSTPCAHSCMQHNIRNIDTKRSFDSAVNAFASAVVPFGLMPLPASSCALHVSRGYSIASHTAWYQRVGCTAALGTWQVQQRGL